MNERRPDHLTNSLKHLGESRASEGFTTRVLQGLDRRLRRRARVRAAGFGAASVALVMLAAAALNRSRPEAPAHDQAQTKADEIRREHRLLLAELEELRRSRDLAPTVLYLGGDDDYDLVLDLNPLLDEMTRPGAVPASFAPTARPVGANDNPRRRP